ncbi:hypothetical protein FP435_03110 [Lactobacillus sp. PV037]|uniref:hypothetical protein n=1 Tax=unclassified Lactobacillus TaxID=2620435 RepID=UPI00223FDEB8|nr:MULTISPECIES: hypothetical protein [unclassified Lactobacillus]QNQ82385.1 hypothetical protein FP433_04715 [Lactobacillus sp. PV012]QNQ83501.1 hypothetical protein FP435_03110 [Lactobacillus sp. PV037]
MKFLQLTAVSYSSKLWLVILVGLILILVITIIMGIMSNTKHSSKNMTTRIAYCRIVQNLITVISIPTLLETIFKDDIIADNVLASIDLVLMILVLILVLYYEVKWENTNIDNANAESKQIMISPDKISIDKKEKSKDTK